MNPPQVLARISVKFGTVCSLSSRKAHDGNELQSPHTFLTAPLRPHSYSHSKTAKAPQLNSFCKKRASFANQVSHLCRYASLKKSIICGILQILHGVSFDRPSFKELQEDSRRKAESRVYEFSTPSTKITQ